MKRTIALLAAGWLLWAGTLRAQEATGLTQVLRQIEANNKELQSAVQQAKAAQWENRSGNNLPDPTLSYAHVWDSRDSEITQGELIVSQGFDFPTLYASRHRMNRHANAAIDQELQATRQRILLEAKQLCIQLTALHQQRLLFKQRMEQADQLAQLYRKRLDEGDANQLEMNKIKLEQLNAQTAYRLTESTLQSKMQQLLALNGQQPLTAGRPTPLGPAVPTPEAIGLTTFANTPLPENFLTLFGELLAADPQLQALEQSRLAAVKQLSVSRQGWLPKLELGYRRNTDSGHPLNGVVVGFSIPLFENRGKVKSAKLQSMSLGFQREDALGKEQSRLSSLFEEARQLHQQIEAYRTTLSGQQHLTLLDKALKEGEISLIDYFIEATLVYESENNLIELQSQYEQTVAELYRCKL
ncbi:MAG: TolC family protein [Bacteroides sp.]